mmetsp:Transcript_12312/g.23367  ORF Transcript_12312/g.23367 Transcript_12312/m.23367 type:complete len:237 (+) Transcript_12312:707-1417(+)
MAGDSDSDVLILDRSSFSPIIIDSFDDFVDIEKEPQQSPRVWSLAFYQPYFRVSTQTVLERLQKALLLRKGPLFEDYMPDLYGPFWIITTLIFVLAFAGNAGSYLESSEAWTPDVSSVMTASSLLYCAAAALPVYMYFVLSHNGSPATYIEVFSVYCYSFTVFIPFSFLCIVPNHLFRLFVTSAAVGVSLKLLHKTFWADIEIVLKQSKYLHSAIGVSGHLTLWVLSNWYFFEGGS